MLLSHRSKEKEQTIGNNRNNRDGHLISVFSEILQKTFSRRRLKLRSLTKSFSFRSNLQETSFSARFSENFYFEASSIFTMKRKLVVSLVTNVVIFAKTQNYWRY